MVIMPEGRNLRMEATGHQKLEDSINEVFANSGFFGRMDDVQFFAELENELLHCGAKWSSKRTYIYDPKHSLFFAWKELAQHITYMYEIQCS
jgi:hypothetical protein